MPQRTEKTSFLEEESQRSFQSRRQRHDRCRSYSNEDPCQSLSFRLCYKSFTGSFGCSSTYSDIAHIDKGLMEAYLLKYLNCHKDEILLEMAKMMLSDAKEQRDVALAEIDAMKSDLLTMFGCQKENLSASL